MREDVPFGDLKEAEQEPVPDYGDLMTVESFVENVGYGMFIDYDGHGDFATESHIWNVVVYPSDVTQNPKQFLARCAEHGVTHICWYNK